MRLGIIGCGYVADSYVATLVNHPEIIVAGVADRDQERARRFAARHRLTAYGSYGDLLADPTIELVANLTSPRAHHDTSMAALEAGKHVYSEKPLATDWADAVALVEAADQRGLQITSAPATVLGETAQTVWRLLREGAVGRVRAVYAELDEGMIHRERYDTWVSESGNPWPYQDEFEVGCTVEHAGYYLTWLVAMFGPATRVTAFAGCQIPDKSPTPLDPPDTPDLSVGVVELASGVVARLTNSIVASPDHSMRVFGDEGVLRVADSWDMGSPVYLARRTRWSLRLQRRTGLIPLARLGERRQRLVRKPRFVHRTAGSNNRCDYARGIAELAGALREGRPSRLSAAFALHVTEIVLTLQDPGGMGSPRQLTTTCGPMAPMPWADDRA